MILRRLLTLNTSLRNRICATSPNKPITKKGLTISVVATRRGVRVSALSFTSLALPGPTHYLFSAEARSTDKAITITEVMMRERRMAVGSCMVKNTVEKVAWNLG